VLNLFLMHKIFLLICILFSSISMAIFVSPVDHPGDCFNEPNLTTTPAFFPRYLHNNKDEKIQLQGKDKPKQTAFGCQVAYQERFVPIDSLALSVLFFGLAYWKIKRPKKLN